ncbi:hypothetical protein MN116_008723 [Schistosoma mekongi]|uniref:Uncharacterized protein n=1 Tax=Schistosoma mekongi TaxID=38744 RepID=A0AAE1Z6L9_SCHME|nr:hypothetical protein MN116_008723 [Schistosoma mekongi]
MELNNRRNTSQTNGSCKCKLLQSQCNGFQGPICEPKPTYSQPRQWTEEKLRDSEEIISFQAGTNKLASQKCMSFGA